MAKGLKLKVRKFYGLSPTFVEVTEEKLVGGAFSPPPHTHTHSLILNRVKEVTFNVKYFKEIKRSESSKSRGAFRTQARIYDGAFL